MASLAVKYRPNRFEDVVGQTITLDILKNQLKNDSLAATIGFFGASGCGKTTVARIVSNMLNDNKGHPIEIDAASNNSVDNVRQIIENASQRSLDSKYKIFIIDECHAITPQGWAAFLKLLEEPNKYTKFIFCTTNPEKIPDTVISRMQVFNFTKISDNEIVNRLKSICTSENIDIGSDSLEFIARISNGSVRQSITNLEKCLNLGKDLSYESVIDVIGSGSYDLMSDFLIGVFNNDYKLAINIVETVYRSGKDLRQFVFEVLKFVLDLYKVCIFGDFSLTSIPNTPQINSVLNYKNKFNDFIDFISDFYENNKQSSEIRFIFEAKLLKVCRV